MKFCLIILQLKYISSKVILIGVSYNIDAPFHILLRWSKGGVLSIPPMNIYEMKGSPILRIEYSLHGGYNITLI